MISLWNGFLTDALLKLHFLLYEHLCPDDPPNSDNTETEEPSCQQI